MNRHYIFLSLFLSIIIIFWCFKKQINNNNLWIGAYSLFDPLDQKSAIPVDNNLLLINDSTVNLILDGKIVDTIINTDSSKKFEIKNKNLILFNKYVFFSSLEYKNNPQLLISNSCWENEDYLLCFKENTLIVKNFKTKHIIYKCFENEMINSIAILNLFGNKWDCDKENVFFKLQVLQIDDNTIRVKGYLDDETYEKSFKSTKTTINSSDFSLCNDLLYANYPGYRYYATQTFFKGGIYNISKIFNQKYKVPADIKESGLIRVRFIVNCKGETGEFEMVEMDNNYSPKPFSPIISAQILNICKVLNEWVPGKFDDQNVDSYKFLTFKIQKSEIVEIFP